MGAWLLPLASAPRGCPSGHADRRGGAVDSRRGRVHGGHWAHAPGPAPPRLEARASASPVRCGPGGGRPGGLAAWGGGGAEARTNAQCPGHMRYPLAAVRRRGRGPFTDAEWEFILRVYDTIRHSPELLDRRVDEFLDQLAGRRHRWRRFANDEAEWILETFAAVQQYQERLAERVRRLETAEDEKALDEAGSGRGSDLLLAVLTL